MHRRSDAMSRTPPNGHAFGFPKPFPYADDEEPAGDALDVWLLANGYPQEWIDLFPHGVPYRIIWLGEE